jgi:anti-anti-sigma factor
MFGMERFLRRFPAPLCAVVIGIAASGLLGLKQAGIELAGDIPRGLPSPALPDLALIGTLWPGALGIALIAFIESIAAGRAFAKHGEPRPDADRELIALGASNIAGSFFRIMPSGGGTSQTAVNDKAGARTQMAQIVTALMVLAVLLLLSPLISLMPHATLAAVVVVTTLGLINPAEFRAISKVRKIELSWALAAFAGVVVLGTLNGILIAVGISMLTLTYVANHPPIYALGRKPGTDIFRPRSPDHPEDETFPGLLIARSEGAMTFGSAPRLRDGLKDLIDEAKPRVLLLDMSAIPFMEYTALKLFMNLEEKTREAGITFWMAALNPRVFEMVKRSPLFAAMGYERMFHNLEEAVEAYVKETASDK